MNKRVLIIEIAVFVFIAALLIFLGSVRNRNVEARNISGVSEVAIKVDRVEVFMFHATSRCATCIAIGQLTGATINEYFSDEIASGKIEFREVNVDLSENKELAEKFQASGSSLKINAIYDNKDHISEDVTVWRLASNDVQFKNYLKDKLDNILGK